MKPEEIYILVGCEESQAVTIAFRKRGFMAFSCDIQDCSGGHPEWHIKSDVFEAINSRKWDVGIFFPPCTFICNGAQSNITRRPHLGILQKRENQGVPFFMKIVNASINHIAIENPIGVMSSRYRKPDQIIRPWMFGHEYKKDVCLWLKNFPKLEATKITPGPYKKLDFWSTKRNPGGISLKSKTFQGIANAMAEQWGDYLLKNIQP